jgi:hypothetical protein
MADIQTSFGVNGREVQDILDKIGLSANCNSIPDDKLPPFRPSGLQARNAGYNNARAKRRAHGANSKLDAAGN